MVEITPLKCIVVTPEKAIFDEPADFVVVPLYDGELGIGHDRLPLIGRLGFGELRITQAGKIRSYYIDGGFVQVRNNIVSVLTSKAVLASDIKADAATEVLRTRKAELTPEGQEAQTKAKERARAQLRIAHKLKEHAGH